MKKIAALIVLCFASLGITAPAQAVITGYLKIAGMEGESKAPMHEGETEILSWSWGVEQGTVGTAQTSSAQPKGIAETSTLTFTKYVDSTSLVLLNNCCNAKSFDEVIIVIRKDSGDTAEYIEIELENVQITSYQTGASGNDDDPRPVEKIVFNYDKIDFNYIRPERDGDRYGEHVELKWDNVKHKKWGRY